VAPLGFYFESDVIICDVTFSGARKHAPPEKFWIFEEAFLALWRHAEKKIFIFSQCKPNKNSLKNISITFL
jgi:hypothetical protein